MQKDEPQPIIFREFPKMLVHPAMDKARNANMPVIVHNEDQEEYQKSMGYVQEGSADPFAFIAEKATEKVGIAIEGMRQAATRALDATVVKQFDRLLSDIGKLFVQDNTRWRSHFEQLNWRVEEMTKSLRQVLTLVERSSEHPQKPKRKKIKRTKRSRTKR